MYAFLSIAFYNDFECYAYLNSSLLSLQYCLPKSDFQYNSMNSSYFPNNLKRKPRQSQRILISKK